MNFMGDYKTWSTTQEKMLKCIHFMFKKRETFKTWRLFSVLSTPFNKIGLISHKTILVSLFGRPHEESMTVCIAHMYSTPPDCLSQ